MFSMNRVHIIGYQTQPVTVRQTPGGASVTDLNLVVPYSFRADSGEMLDGKGFHTITLWGPMAEVAGKYVRPGSQLFVSGRLQTDSWKDRASGQDKERTEFHNVVVWGALADHVAKNIKKGNRVFATGRVQTRSWETREGSKRYTTEIIADAVSLLGVKNATAASSFQTDAVAAPRHEEPMGDLAQASVAVPEISYASEVKASDLPF